MTELGIPAQIKVNQSPVPDAAGSNLRVLFMVVGAWAMGRGWVKADTMTMLVSAGLIIIPWAWGQVKGWNTSRKLASIASDPRVPESVVGFK